MTRLEEPAALLLLLFFFRLRLLRITLFAAFLCFGGGNAARVIACFARLLRVLAAAGPGVAR